METNRDDFEPKPGYSLIKYGAIFTINFNTEFAQRLNNILADFHGTSKLPPPLDEFSKQLGGQLELGVDSGDYASPTNPQFKLVRFGYVYAACLQREFVEKVHMVMSQFLIQNRISPALFSFVKQLELCLYPKKFDTRTTYADER